MTQKHSNMVNEKLIKVDFVFFIQLNLSSMKKIIKIYCID